MALLIPNVIGSSVDPAPLSDIQAMPDAGHWRWLAPDEVGRVATGCLVRPRADAYSPAATVSDGGDGVTAGQTTIGYASAGDPISVNDVVNIDFEDMLVTGVDTGTNTLTVTRGYNGTTAVSHGESGEIRNATTPNATVYIHDGRVLSPTVDNEPTVTAGSVTIGNMDATNPRLDVVVATGSGSKVVRAGAAAGTPLLPQLNDGDTPLAVIYVPIGSGAPTITRDNIRDARIFYLGTEDTPIGRLYLKRQLTPAPPVSTRLIAYNKVVGLDDRLHLLSTDGRELGPIGDIAGHLLFQKAQRGGYSAPASGNAWDGFWGLLGGAVSGDFTGTTSVINNADGRQIQCDTSSTINTNAGYRSANVLARRGSTGNFGDPRFMVKLRIPTITSIRVFIGWTDLSLAAQLASDGPTGTYMGCSFSTGHSDTQFQAENFDGAGTVRYTASGVTVAANTTYYIVVVGRGTLQPQMSIYDKDFILLSATTYSLFDLPGANTDMAFMFGCQNLTGAVRTIQTGYGNVMAQGA